MPNKSKAKDSNGIKEKINVNVLPKAKDNNGVKENINVNVLPMATPLKKGNELVNSTPANDRTGKDYAKPMNFNFF